MGGLEWRHFSGEMIGRNRAAILLYLRNKLPFSVAESKHYSMMSLPPVKFTLASPIRPLLKIDLAQFEKVDPLVQQSISRDFWVSLVEHSRFYFASSLLTFWFFCLFV